MSKYFQVYDTYREKFLIGELVWNFADFETAQGELGLSTSL